MDRDEQAAGQAAYGATLRRLQVVKAAYDPGNVFRLNQKITPLSQDSTSAGGQSTPSDAGRAPVAAS